MPLTLRLANFICQELVCCGGIDIFTAVADPLPMAKAVKQVSRNRPDTVENARLRYLGQWIYACGKKPAEVCRETGINPGYMSELIKGTKKNPSTSKLWAIADFLGISADNFAKPPPSATVLEQIAQYDPKVVEKLLRKRPIQD